MELTVIQVDIVLGVSLKAQTRHVCHTREIGLQCDQREIPLALTLSLSPSLPACLLRQSISTLANKFAWRIGAHKSVCSISALRVD